MINNYMLIITLQFDKKKQEFEVQIMNRTNDYGMLHRRFSSSIVNFGLFISEDDNIYVQTNNQIKPIKNNIDYLLFDLKSSCFSPDNLNTKLLKNNKSSVPHHHPEFLQEVLLMADLGALEIVFQKVGQSLVRNGCLNNQFYLSLDELQNSQTSEERQRFWSELLLEGDRKVDLLYEMEEEWSPLESLLQLLKRPQLRLGLYPQEQLGLVDCLDYLIQFKKNSRSLDLPAALFMFFVKKWSKKSRGKQCVSCLLTKEVVWALHTQHKDYLIQELIQSQPKDSLQWSSIRQYCVPLWYDDIQFLTQLVETLAKNTYRDKKDPSQVVLYYVLLGKQTLLSLLFKQQGSGSSMKISEFLKNDFKEERWKSACSKNGYALLGKKDYQQSSGFFLLGGHIQECINVIVEHMHDLQLALLVAKTLNHQPIIHQIYQDNFLNQTDQWAQHIALFQQGSKVKSINVFAYPSQNNYQQYPLNYTPVNSSFHPNSLVLVQELVNTVGIKRQLLEDRDLQLEQDYVSHLQSSLQYYISIDNPVLGLHWYLQQQKNINDIPTVTQKLLLVLINKFIRFFLLRAYLEQDWSNQYNNLNSNLQQLKPFIQLCDEQQQQSILWKQIQMSRSLKYQVAYHLYQHQYSNISPLIQKYSQKLVYILDYLCKSSPLRHFDQAFYLNILYALEEINQSLWLLIRSNKKEDEQDLQSYQKLAYLGLFLVANNLQLYEHQLTLMKRIANYRNSTELMDDQQELQSISKEIKVHVQEFVYQYKYKSNKQSKYMDSLSEAFPTNPYQLSHNAQKYTFIKKDCLYKHLFLSNVLNLIFLSNFSRFMDMTFCLSQVETCIKDGIKRQFKACLSMSNMFTGEETVEILEQIRVLMTLDQPEAIIKQKILDSFKTKIPLDLIQTISMKLQCSQTIDELILKALISLNKTNNINWSLSIENTKTQYITQPLQIIRTSHHLKAFCYDQFLNNNTLILLTNKGLFKYNLYDQFFKRARSQDQYNLLDETTSSSSLIPLLPLQLCYSLLSQHSSNKLSSIKQLYSDKEQDQQSNEQRDMSDYQLIVSSPTESMLVAAGKGRLQLIDMCSMETIQTMNTQSEALILMIKFNNQGDRIGCVDSQGVFYIFRLSNNTRSINPIHILNSNKQVILDFTFTNNSSMFATIAQQPKPSLVIQDVLLKSPGIIQQEAVGGNYIQFSNPYQLLIVGNLKRNSLYFYTVDKQTIVKTFEFSPQQEFRLFVLNKHQNCLVSSHSDGSFKLIQLEDAEIVREIKGKECENSKIICNLLKEKKQDNKTIEMIQMGYSILEGSGDGTISVIVASLL